MPLTLRALSLNDQPLSQPIAARFNEHGGTIGRNDNNTLALPDPERHISRQQAEIRVDRGGYLIRNVGSANPIVVRNQTLAFGETAPLADSDRVRIGGYVLEVVADDDSADATVASAPSPADTPPGGGHGMGALGASLSSDNPFAQLFGAPAPATRPAAGGGAAAPRSRLPDDFDPFAMPSAAPAAARSSGDADATTPFDDLLPRGATPSVDEMFGLRPVDGRDPLADFASDLPLPSPGERKDAVGVDALARFGVRASAPPVARTSADRASDLQAAFKPPTAASARPRPLPASARPGAPASASPTPATGAWAAFCEGAGVPVDTVAGADAEAEALRAAGTLLRATIEGTLRLMNVRSTTRNELRADVTMIRSKDNNPLKFSPDAQSALEQLLRPPLRGFLPGPAAITSAMNDLVGHGLGTMTGTRAALDGVLARFEPRQLEACLAGKNMLDTLLPMNRKARLWELYLQRYAGIRDEAQDNFHALFGKDFLAAYDNQVAQLRREHAVAASGAADGG